MDRFELRISYKEDPLGFIADPMDFQYPNGNIHTFRCGWGKTKEEALAHCIDRNKPFLEAYRETL